MSFLQHIRYALRSMRKAPGFTAVAIITLALGIGANTAIFTVVNTVFFNPIPVRNAERLVTLYTIDPGVSAKGFTFFPISHPNGQDIARQIDAFSGVSFHTYGGFFRVGVSMTVDGQPSQFVADIVTANYFDVLGVPASKGRTFRPEEGLDAAGPVVVLNYGFWLRKFAGNPNVVGQNVLLNGQGFTIIGVAPRGFEGPNVLGGPDMWVTTSMHDQILPGFMKDWYESRRALLFLGVARLKDGVSLAQANQQLKALASNLEQAFPAANKGRTFLAVPLLQSAISPNQRDTFAFAGVMLMIVVGLVLLIACANIANLLLSRAARRQREISIRLAVGASRSRIVAQLLTESLVLALAGGAVGLGIAVVARNLLWNFRPPSLAVTNLRLALDHRVLFFNLGIALATGVIFGLAPALRSSRPDLVSELKERTGAEAAASRRFGLGNLFVMAQVALSVVALIGAGVFLVSLRNAQQTDPGFDPHNLGMITFDVGSLNYEASRVREFQRRVLEVVQSTPGVQQASLSSSVPLLDVSPGRSVYPEGGDPVIHRNGMIGQADSISPDYLPTMVIPLLRGRGFDSSVREDSPKVVVLNETAAQRFFPNQDAIGKRFKFFGEDEWVQVIGVARDSKYNTIGEDPLPHMYLSLLQYPSSAVTIFFRTKPDTRSVVGAVRNRVQELDPNLPLTNVWPIGEVFSQALWAPRFAASLLGIFALIAMLLCSVGIYGVVSYSVGQRVREMGVRLALGAQPSDVLLMVLRQSAATIGIGLAVGLATALVLVYLSARLLSELLFGVHAANPLPFLGTALGLALVGLLATYIPARRAASVDPMVALHYE